MGTNSGTRPLGNAETQAMMAIIETTEQTIVGAAVPSLSNEDKLTIVEYETSELIAVKRWLFLEETIGNELHLTAE